MNTKTKTTSYIVHSIAAAVLVLSAQISLAGSATWLSSPQDSALENANNWTPGGPPNGASDITTFAQLSQRHVNITTSEEVNSIDPTLELHDHTGALIASNDNWQQTIIGGIITRDQVQDIMNSGHAPTQPSESAIIADLPPGNYTAIVRGVNNTAGVALVDV
jgi:hypothetical protein